jgi:hypothetical protein
MFGGDRLVQRWGFSSAHDDLLVVFPLQIVRQTAQSSLVPNLYWWSSGQLTPGRSCDLPHSEAHRSQLAAEICPVSVEEQALRRRMLLPAGEYWRRRYPTPLFGPTATFALVTHPHW